jgi:sugar-specific transcriptional regulator TrmB
VIEEEFVRTLVNLGLSFLQAKTYLNLVRLEKADVRTISRASNVSRQDIYRIMPTLQKWGLAEKNLAKPTIYIATPIKEALSILLQNRKKEYFEVQKETNLLLKNFNVNNPKIVLQEEDSQFTITSELTLLLKMLEKLTQKAQTSIDMAIPLELVEHHLFHNLQYFKRAIKRGVKLRLVTQKSEGQLNPRKPKALAESPLFELKYVPNHALVSTYSSASFRMHIFDKKEITLCVSEKDAVPCLWSNNPNTLRLATNYFDVLWNSTKETVEQATNSNKKYMKRQT